METKTEERTYWGCLEGSDKRWFIYIYPDGRILAVDSGSPTGNQEWITAEQLNRANPASWR